MVGVAEAEAACPIPLEQQKGYRPCPGVRVWGSLCFAGSTAELHVSRRGGACAVQLSLAEGLRNTYSLLLRLLING